MPLQVRCPTPSPDETGGHTWMHAFFMSSFTPPCKHTKLTSVTKRILLRGDKRFFYSPGFLRWIAFNGMWLFNKISHVCIFLLFYLIKLSIWAIHFAAFPFMPRVFFGHANETSRRRMGGGMPIVSSGNTPLGGNFYFSVSEDRWGVFHPTVSCC